jgi:hypothetical protein
MNGESNQQLDANKKRHSSTHIKAHILKAHIASAHQRYYLFFA